jgi:hypothetical protein
MVCKFHDSHFFCVFDNVRLTQAAAFNFTSLVVARLALGTCEAAFGCCVVMYFCEFERSQYPIAGFEVP